ncbi:MAG: ABC transporter permease, partial [Candidatus Firestonebacteria bacterium]
MENKFEIHKVVWGRLKKNRLALLGGAFICLFILTAVLAPLLTVYDPTGQNISERLQAPSLTHLLGTDELGRDVLSRMAYGARISLSVGFIAVFISTFLGILFGAIAGYFGGAVDQVIMRFVDILLSIPTLFLILMLIVFLGPGIFNVMLVIGVTGWTDLARLVRAEFLSLKEREYVQAAKASGSSHSRIIFRHILPNSLSPVFVSVIFGVAGAILLESGLSFLGLGVQPPSASWGNILTSGKDYIEVAW